MNKAHIFDYASGVDAARQMRAEYYALVEALSSIRLLSEIDVKRTTQDELLLYAAETLVRHLDFESCKIVDLVEGEVDTSVFARVVKRERSDAASGFDFEVSAYIEDAGNGPNCVDDIQLSSSCGDCFGDSLSELKHCPNETGDPVCVPVRVFEEEVIVIHAFSFDPEDVQPSRRQALIVFGRFLGQLMKGYRLICDMDTLVNDKTREIAYTNDRLRREIEDRKRVEHQVRDAKERFKDFAEVAADWFWETAPDLTVTYLSERYQEVTGIDPANVVGRPYATIPESADADGWRMHIEDLRKRLPVKNFQFTSRWRDGTPRIFSVNGKPVYSKLGEFQGYRGAGQDVTKAQQLLKQLAYNATHDPLTGLTNRQHFETRLRQLIDESKDQKLEHYLCYLDLDQFKVINDTCGHKAGDELLRQLAEVLPKNVRKNDIFARLGGDEFGLLITDCCANDAMRIANSLYQAIQEFRFSWKSAVFSLGVSIGVVPVNQRTNSVTSALSAADTACYVAKSEGRNRIHINDENGTQLQQWKREMLWVSRITRALEEHRFELVFHPIVSVLPEHRDEMRYELLVRMRDESGELVMPGQFLPAAERYSMSTRIDRWVVDAALDWLLEHPDHLERLQSCSINLSGHSVGDREFHRFLNRQFDNKAIPADKICFEITETAVVADLPKTTRFMQAFQARGCRFALDDFGSGLSSFAYLKNLPVDYVKIDGLFIKDIAEDPVQFAMVRSINDISHLMGKRTIAEYVEGERALEMLRRIGVDYAQGHGISRPLPLEEREFKAFQQSYLRNQTG